MDTVATKSKQAAPPVEHIVCSLCGDGKTPDLFTGLPPAEDWVNIPTRTKQPPFSAWICPRCKASIIAAGTEALNRLRDAVHGNAVAKGFHPAYESEAQYIAQTCANLHGEVSELWEAHRKHDLLEQCDKEGCPLTCEEEEVADLIIRALDYSGHRKVDIAKAVRAKMAYNATRAFRHGGKAA